MRVVDRIHLLCQQDIRVRFLDSFLSVPIWFISLFGGNLLMEEDVAVEHTHNECVTSQEGYFSQCVFW